MPNRQMIDRRTAIATGLAGAASLAAGGARAQTLAGPLVFLNLSGSKVMTCNLDGSNVRALVEGQGSSGPDGVTFDSASQRIVWTNMGGVSANDGTLMSCDLAGGDVKTLVAAGGTFTPKQAKYDVDRRRIYWSDREGLPEPIDLEIEQRSRRLYWTDRGDNTVNRAPMELPAGANPAARTDRQILVRGLREAIGLALDPRNNRMFYTSLGGEVGSAAMDGSDAKTLLTGQGSLTGITLIEAPNRDYFGG